ncbi:hypothetical protein HBH53_210550 [Parastagonospora nodorum]|nr:hypothetical protein HBH53_210550 [Parastagonospora nodorum]KAH3958468.1 hypothetical protein HBH51_209080 [Parastagonospora nodorum]KAH3978033.1 hypothetical protein HBH52_108890 [Parastagonospora nodorum]KAH4001736.1 hypothetical protein HBI10_090710 [Parastagonospora nodorum]KAH4027480.1 hypothetical protein HBI13_059730 [Parastagonospora nodorum]
METAGNLFMRIPAELRSIIYEYALTEDHPLSVKKPNGHAIYAALHPQLRDRHHLQILSTGLSHPYGVRKTAEANQLRFANKQMYHETRGLSLHYNAIEFTNVEDAHYFLKRCATLHLSKLRLVTIRWADQNTFGVPDPKIWQNISNFCQLYPSAMVRVHVSDRSPNTLHTLLWLARYEAQIRDTRSLFTALIEENSVFRDVVRPCLPLAPGMPVVHDSLRFFPAAEVFDEEEFVRNADNRHSFLVLPLALRLGGFRGGLDGLVSLMKHVVEHGA